MQIIDKKIGEIKPYEKNPRKNDNAIDAVASSISQFGFKNPIVIDGNNVIICGHTRYKAAQKLGLDVVPCVVASDLTDEQIRAYRLADNKVAELAEWDIDLLGEELDGIFDIDMSDFGFISSSGSNFIDDLYEQMVGDHEVNESTFQVSFYFDKKYETAVNSYIKDNGKDGIVHKILEVVGIA